MMWFFAVLVVLAMGGIAAVAAGHGRPLAVEYEDRPDVSVPAHQPLVEDDVRRVRFSTALLGYRQSEVDALLDRLARELADRTSRSSGEQEPLAPIEPVAPVDLVKPTQPVSSESSQPVWSEPVEPVER